MGLSNPTSTRPPSTVRDVENGDGIDRSTTPRPFDEHPSEFATPDSRLSGEFAATRTRAQWRDSPRWKRVHDHIPPPLSRAGYKVAQWVRGPQPPKEYRIKPLFESVQTFPIRLLGRLPRLARICVYICAFMLWIIVFGVLLRKFGLPNDFVGFGTPVRLSCVARLWSDARSCGIDGRNCLPFDGSSFPFSCPADCAGVSVLNPKAIGDYSINYRPLVIGGAPNTSEADHLNYRGDSFICGAAIHAGVLQDSKGGCGVLNLVGEKNSYGSATRNGISSIPFDSVFPMSFDFNRNDTVAGSSGKCTDPRWSLLGLSIVMTCVFSLFTSHPATFFAPVFVITYFQIAMASDPPANADYPTLASTALGNFLPAAFIALIMYRISICRTLHGLRAQVEKTVLWVGGCWVGALSNVTLEKIPINRLTAHDLNQQPGAITALVFIVIILAAIAIHQAWCFRNEGRLLRYLSIYAVLGICLGILTAVPSLDLRIHHYILALLLLPGTALQTRPSLLYQGLLVGLFINGIARWGFAPLLQTAAALRGDALLATGIIPSILPPNITATNLTFTWDGLARGYEGVSVLVNDVERFRGFHKDGDNSFTWTRTAAEDLPEYFRFGFVNYVPFGGVTYSDFTRAGIWWGNGTWVDIPPGIT
ncbi:hypothetical protein K458DRAFT_305534 [Lentithecium fluviatile CBS 122367]|uniref:LCCL domain-containing protein n=1 Tax=Lentithecium fluviatile CBS 122367 TaxID=1168545 RepID=A0A6G1IZU5_9PLEO|nr:hypothetical protein K458DRAFT_305534 [Lentithecium fluviatile CBS 122367]